MATRGGRREGAGRPQKLDDGARLYIGGKCEELWLAECERKLQTANKEAIADFQPEYDSARAVPVKDRKAWLKTFAGKDHKDNMEFARKEHASIPAEEEVEDLAIMIHLEAKRPKGVRKQIIAQVAISEGEKRGLPLSERMVERCWKEFRSLQNEVRAERDDEGEEF